MKRWAMDVLRRSLYGFLALGSLGMLVVALGLIIPVWLVTGKDSVAWTTKVVEEMWDCFRFDLNLKDE